MIFTKKTCLLLIFYFSFQNVLFCSGTNIAKKDSISPDKNKIILDEELVTRSLNLCKDYILKNQSFIGNFHYQYDLTTRKFIHKDRAVRQAGALWSLSLYYSETGDTIVEKALLKALDFFILNSRLTSTNGRFFIYPGEKAGEVGAIAVLSLALIDYLRTANNMDAEKKHTYRKYLDEFINYLLLARDSTHLWHTKYNKLNGISYNDSSKFNGRTYDASSPYFDGESLLALVKAAKYFNRKDLIDKILQSADTCYERYIKDEIKKDTSQLITGFYMWGVMSYFEITSSGWPNTNKYGDYINLMTDWMVDVHKVENKFGAAPYEGILHAYELAKTKKDEKQLLKLKTVIETGIIKQIGLQVGGPIPNNYIITYNITDERISGGISTAGPLPIIRIDNVQHQLCALLYTRKYYFSMK